MNVDTGLYGDYEIAGKMLEEHERRDQQVSIEVNKFENKTIFGDIFLIKLLKLLLMKIKKSQISLENPPYRDFHS